MRIDDFDKIIEYQVSLRLKEKGLKVLDLKHMEVLKMKYEIALLLLSELGGKDE